MNVVDLTNTIEVHTWVQYALAHYHDLDALSRSPLTQTTIVRQRMHASPRASGELVSSPDTHLGKEIQRLIDDAIDGLKPSSPETRTDPAWQTYHVLDRTYRRTPPRPAGMPSALDIDPAAYEAARARGIAGVAGLLQSWEAVARAEMGSEPGSGDGSGSRWEPALPPASYPRLFGFDALLDDLVAQLVDRHDAWLTLVEGLEGSGKTSLAREAVRCAAGESVLDSVIWLTVPTRPEVGRPASRGEAPVSAVDGVLDALAAHLGLSRLIGWPTVEKRHEIRAALRRHPSLIVVDNLEGEAESAEVAALLWGLANPSKALITTRSWLDLGPDARVLHTHPLDRASAHAFAAHDARARGASTVTEYTLDTIYAVTGGDPLTIKLLMGQTRNLPLAQVVDRVTMGSVSARLFTRYLYRRAWSMLSEDERALLLAMPVLANGGGGLEALGAISGLSDVSTRAAVETLVSLSLLDRSEGPRVRYTIHPLLHRFLVSDVLAGLSGEEG